MIRIQVEIPTEQIARLIQTAIESGDPVTTASRGGWCDGIYWRSADQPPPDGLWYAEKENFAGAFQLSVHEITDEKTGRKKKHVLTPAKMATGLSTMLTLFPTHFTRILDDDIDAPCADIFLQCCLFGEEKYA